MLFMSYGADDLDLRRGKMEPVWEKETIIYNDLDMQLVASCKMEHDVIGHYARPDVLELIVKE